MKMRIMVNIQNEDDSEVAEATMIEVDVPEFEAFTGSDKFGEIFDQYERKVLKARNEAVEAVTEKYLSELAKKTHSEARGRKIVERSKQYAIDAEIGRLEIQTFEIQEGSHQIFHTGRDAFPQTGPREHYPSPCFRELVVFFPCDDTFRRSEHKINRVLWRQEKKDRVQSRTIANLVEREGKQIQEQIGKKAEGILESNGFTREGKLTSGEKAFELPDPEAFFPPVTVCKMIEELNEENTKEQHITLSKLDERFEVPHAIKANISIDDVCCKKQKAEGRKKGSSPKEKREMVYNTVAHIQSGASKTYTLNTSTITHMMIMVLAFLLHHGLMSIPGP